MQGILGCEYSKKGNDILNGDNYNPDQLEIIQTLCMPGQVKIKDKVYPMT